MAKKRPADTTPPPAQPEVQIVRANVNRSVETSPDFVSIYANDAQIQLTPWDIRLILGVISNVPAEDQPTIIVRQLGEVRMSLPLAKRLVMILIGQLKHYEETVGPITLPTD